MVMPVAAPFLSAAFSFRRRSSSFFTSSSDIVTPLIRAHSPPGQSAALRISVELILVPHPPFVLKQETVVQVRECESSPRTFRLRTDSRLARHAPIHHAPADALARAAACCATPLSFDQALFRVACALQARADR